MLAKENMRLRGQLDIMRSQVKKMSTEERKKIWIGTLPDLEAQDAWRSKQHLSPLSLEKSLWVIRTNQIRCNDQS